MINVGWVKIELLYLVELVVVGDDINLSALLFFLVFGLSYLD